MNKIYIYIVIAAAIIAAGCKSTDIESYNAASDSLRFTNEVHLRNIKQLTFGGNNEMIYLT